MAVGNQIELGPHITGCTLVRKPELLSVQNTNVSM